MCYVEGFDVHTRHRPSDIPHDSSVSLSFNILPAKINFCSAMGILVFSSTAFFTSSTVAEPATSTLTFSFRNFTTMLMVSLAIFKGLFIQADNQ